MKTIKKNIFEYDSKYGKKYQVCKTHFGEVKRKTFDNIEDAENYLNELKATDKEKNNDYPMNFIESLFGNDETIDIGYIEQHFDENIKIVMETLTEREQRILTKRFMDGYTLDAVGKQEGVTKDRIRQIEAKALRKLRHPSRLYRLRFGEKALEMQDDIKRLTKELAEQQWILYENIKVAKAEVSDKYAPYSGTDILIYNLDIEKLDLSVRSWNCLHRANIKTIKDIVDLGYDGIYRIRNLGRKSVREIAEKLNEYGIKIPVGNMPDILEDGKLNTNDYDRITSIRLRLNKLMKDINSSNNFLIGDASNMIHHLQSVENSLSEIQKRWRER